MKFEFLKYDNSSQIPLEIEEIKLSPYEYATYAFEYALHQVKEIKDPKIAAKEFKKIANEFLNNLID